MNEDKNNKFLFSTPVKPKKIQIFKRKKEEEQGDVYEQLSKILEDGSTGDVQEESLIYSREIERDEFLHEENETTQEIEHKQDEKDLPNISYHKRLKTLSSPQKYKDLSTPESKLSNFQTSSSKNRLRSPKRPIGNNLRSNRMTNHKVVDDDFKNQQSISNKPSPFLIDPPDSSSIDQPESPKNQPDSPKKHLKSPKNQINSQKVDQTYSFPTNQINSHEINSHNLNQQSQNLSLPYAISNLESFSTVSICSLLVDKISKESSLIIKLENDLNLLKNSIKEKEEIHENSIKFVGELKQTNCDLMHKNDSLKIELEKTNEMFSKYKDDMTKIISSLSDNVNVCILENTRLSKDNYSMRSNIYLLENVFKEENVTYQVKEELDNYVEEISRPFTLKQNLKIKKIFNTATGILRIALGMVGEEIELVEVSKKEIENFKEESDLNFKEKENKITNYYLGVINGMNENLEECCFKILEEQSKVESVYFTFRNEIKRLKKKIKKMKKKRVKKTSSDSDIWDVFK